MPRTSRAVVAEHCYHLLNRGNNQMRLFHDRADYAAFLWLIAESLEHVDVPILAMCVMPNHFHVVVRPQRDADLARWAHWLFTTHARRYHKKYHTSGRVWQGRFKASLVKSDEHLLTVLRYVERNALRASLVSRAETWEWGSSYWRLTGNSPIALSAPPVPLPGNWRDYVNAPQSSTEVDAIRQALNRQAPIGDAAWTAHQAAALGISHSLAPLGRPRRSVVTAK
jgi:putative transposase